MFPNPPSPTELPNSSFETASTSTNISSVADNNHPPAVNRQRVGTTPSPIKVTRDPHDVTVYDFAVTPLTGGSEYSGTSASGESENIHQTFPESPTFSASFAHSPLPTSPLGSSYTHDGDLMSVVIPQTPLSPFLLGPAGGSVHPSPTQQMLLTRAASSVQGARHSRQASLAKSKGKWGQPPISTAMAVAPSTNDVEADAAVLSSKRTGAGVEGVAAATHLEVAEKCAAFSESEDVMISSRDTQSAAAMASRPQPESSTAFRGQSPANISKAGPVPPSQTLMSPDSVGRTSTPTLSFYSVGDENSIVGFRSSPIERNTPSRAAVANSASSEQAFDNLSSNQSKMYLDTSKALPLTPASGQISPIKSVASAAIGNDTPSSSGTSPRVTHNTVVQQKVPLTRTPELPPTHTNITKRSVMIYPPVSESQLPTTQRSSTSTSSPYDYSRAGSPPPYYSVVERAVTEVLPMGHNATRGYERPQLDLPRSPFPDPLDFHGGGSNEQLSQPGPGHQSSRRNRPRPPLPAGPRRPSAQFPSAMRERGGSVSSVGSTIPSTRRPHTNPLLPSPKFETPPAKFRGYTMDAAKWTFTSTQLQDIVSRAIRQSSEASSIRLLRLETLDNDIPQELEALDIQRHDVKQKYKSFARRRANILDLLTSCLDATDSEGTARASRLVEDLKDVSATLDRLAEELHSLDEQHAQITRLCELHSASALAMALRKLNTSFLNKMTDVESLRQRVEALEAERDEAWRQAEGVAVDYDYLRSGIAGLSPDGANNRFCRILAVRKSSSRAASAGLHSASLRVSSRSSTRRSLQDPSTSSAVTTENPPVRRIPRRQRPGDIMTNLPLPRASMVRCPSPAIY